MCFEWFTKGQHDLESDIQQQLFKEKILKLEPYEITMNGKVDHPITCPSGCLLLGYTTQSPGPLGDLLQGWWCVMKHVCSPHAVLGFNLFKTYFENVNLCDHRLKRQGTQLVSGS